MRKCDCSRLSDAFLHCGYLIPCKRRMIAQFFDPGESLSWASLLFFYERTFTFLNNFAQFVDKKFGALSQ